MGALKSGVTGIGRPVPCVFMAIYRLCWTLLLPFSFVRLWWRGRCLPAYRQHWAERLGRVRSTRKIDIWWHAVSVGETIASIPVLTVLRQQYPQLNFWITMSTPTGRDCLMQRLPDTHDFSYAPMDHIWCVKRFLSQVTPRAIVLMETEVWAEVLHQARQRDIPVILANARLSEKSRRGYARFGSFTQAVMRQIWQIKAQSRADADRFLALGCAAQQVSVMGNVKFDLPEAKSRLAMGRQLRAEWQKSKVWVAASTHAGEEAQLLAAHNKVRETYPEALLVLVPRHPDRFDEVAELIADMGLEFVRRTGNQAVCDSTAVYLGDTMGELLSLMAASDLAFVGGSLVPHGGHNLLEPIVCGVPVLTGPHVHNFSHIHHLLAEADGIRTVGSADALSQTLLMLWADDTLRDSLLQAARRVLRDNQGATLRLLGTIEDALGLREALQEQRDVLYGRVDG